MFTLLEMLALVESENSFGAYVCHRRPAELHATSALVRCMCMCVIVVTMRGWADVGLWVAVCFLAKISLHRPSCKTTFARLTQSQAISQSFRVFITFRSRRDTTFFIFRNSFFVQNYRFLYHGDQKISWWTSCRWRAVNFEIHLCISGVTAFGDRSASSMSKWTPAWTLTSEMVPFGSKSVTLSM